MNFMLCMLALKVTNTDNFGFSLDLQFVIEFDEMELSTQMNLILQKLSKSQCDKINLESSFIILRNIFEYFSVSSVSFNVTQVYDRFTPYSSNAFICIRNKDFKIWKNCEIKR